MSNRQKVNDALKSVAGIVTDEQPAFMTDYTQEERAYAMVIGLIGQWAISPDEVHGLGLTDGRTLEILHDITRFMDGKLAEREAAKAVSLSE